MEFKGKAVYVSPVTNGTSKAGKAWSKIDVVLVYDTTNPDFEKSVVFTVMNDNIAKFGIVEGGEYEVELSFSTREYNGRYYMSASAWKCVAVSAPAPAYTPAAPEAQPADNGKDFPF